MSEQLQIAIVGGGIGGLTARSRCGFWSYTSTLDASGYSRETPSRGCSAC